MRRESIARKHSMNFFGHAALAARHFAQLSPLELARACAGAMLPDFIGMLRLGRPELADAAVARGVDYHHLTDHAFHELDSFQQLSRQAFTWLSERELPRGPARAVAHIGVEILLDEVLANDSAARDAYRAALATPLDQALRFTQPSDPERLQALRSDLLELAIYPHAPAPVLVAVRLRRSLACRPRLATDDAGEQLLRAWVESARPLVAAAAPALLAALRARLANAQGAE